MEGRGAKVKRSLRFREEKAFSPTEVINVRSIFLKTTSHAVTLVGNFLSVPPLDGERGGSAVPQPSM